MSAKNKKIDNNLKKRGFNQNYIEKIFIFLSLLSYILIFPPFLKNQALSGHDIASHLTYFRLFTDALSQGQFPVKWVEWIVLGQNQPLFSFYQPLFYYLGQIPHWFGLSILNSSNLTVLTLWLFSGVMTYLFVKNLTKNNLAAIASSSVYVFAPYHILDIFVRAAYPEVSALAFIPGLFWATERIFAKPKKQNVGIFAIFLTLVFLSHPPTLIMFSFPLAFFVSYLFYKDYKNNKQLANFVKKGLYLLLGLILGIGLSSFFALPAFLQQDLINSASLNVGYLDFHDHFACLWQLIWSNWDFGNSVLGCSDKMSFQIGILNWLIIITSIGLLIYFVKKGSHFLENSLNLVFLLIAFFGIYMTLSFSQPFWEGIPYLSFLQFPWRFLSVVIFSVSVLSGILFTYINNKNYKLFLYAAIVILAPLLILNYIKPATYLPEDYFGQDSQNFYKGNAQGQVGFNAELGYMPINAEIILPFQEIPPSEIKIYDNNSKTEVIKNNFSYKEYKISVSKDSAVELFVHYFPGWQISVNGKNIQPFYSSIDGLMRFEVDAGENKIIAEFKNTPLNDLANLISIISFLIVFVLFLPKSLFRLFLS